MKNTTKQLSYDEFAETLQEYEIEGGFGKTLEKGYEMYYLPSDHPQLNTKFKHRNKKKAYQEYLKIQKFCCGGKMAEGGIVKTEKLKPIAYTFYGHWGKRNIPIYYEKEIKGSTFHLVRNVIPKGSKYEGKYVWDIVMDGVSMGTAANFEKGKYSIDNWFKKDYAKGGNIKKTNYEIGNL